MFERIKAVLRPTREPHTWVDPTGVLLRETPGFDCIVCDCPGYQCVDMATCPRFEGTINNVKAH